MEPLPLRADNQYEVLTTCKSALYVYIATSYFQTSGFSFIRPTEAQDKFKYLPQQIFQDGLGRDIMFEK